MDINEFIGNLEILNLRDKNIGILKGTTLLYELSYSFCNFKLGENLAKKLKEEIIWEYNFLKRINFIPSLPLFSFKPAIGFSMLQLILTHNCNFRCNYCYSIYGSYKKRVGNMSFEIACKAIDFLLKNNREDRFTIIFYGGEPLLNYKTLVKIVKYALSKKKKWQFIIATNGSLIDRNIASFLSKYNFGVQLSIDGPPALHNKQRKDRLRRDTYKAVIKGLRYLLEKNVIPSLKATVCSEAEREKVKQHLQKFVPDAMINVDYPSQIKRRHEYQLKVIRNILEASRNYIFEKHLLPEIPYISNYVTPFFFPRIGNSLCPAGFTSFTVDADGEIYLCDSAILSNFFKIGNVKESFPATFKNILVLQDKIVSSLSKCRDCWAMGFCGGSCHIARIQDKIDSEYCNYIKNRSLSIINLLCRVTPDQIIKWYKNRKINKRNKKKGKIEFYQKLHNVFYFHDELIKRLTHLRPLYISFLSNEKRNLYQNCR